MKKTFLGRVAIYARVSTVDKQDYDRQINELTEFLREKGYSKDNIDVFAETVSGYKYEERLKLQELIKITEENPKAYDCIYTSEISRIGRNPKHTRMIVDRWSELGIPLHVQTIAMSTLNDDGTRNTVTNMILQVLIEYADLESNMFKVRSRSGLRKSALQGKAGGSNNFPYGYTKDTFGMLVVDDKEAPIVQRIYDEYEQGNGVKVIAGGLNRDSVQTRLNKTHADREVNFKKTVPKIGSSIQWSDTQVLSILRNTLYKGQRKFKGEVIAAPSIISEEQFDRCTAIRMNKTHKNHLTKYTYLLKNLIKCGHCNRNYFAKYKPVKGGDTVYICSSRLIRGANCGNYGVNIFLIESVINEVVFGNDVILRYIGEKNEMANTIKTEIGNLSKVIALEEQKLTELNASIARLENAYFDRGGMTYEKFADRLELYEQNRHNTTNRLETLRNQLIEKQNSLRSLKAVKTTRKMLSDAMENRTQLETFFHQFISKVVITSKDNTQALASVYIKLGDVVLTYPLLIMLNLSGMRSLPHKYQYKVDYTDNRPNEEGDMFSDDDFEFLPWVDLTSDKVLTM